MNERHAAKAAFEQTIMLAQSEGAEWVETDQETIDLYLPREKFLASVPPGYFVYKNIKVTTSGRAAELEESLNVSNVERLNPGSGHIAGKKTRVKVLDSQAITTLEVER